MVYGKFDGSVLMFDVVVSRKPKGMKLDIPYEDPDDAVRELIKLLGL